MCMLTQRLAADDATEMILMISAAADEAALAADSGVTVADDEAVLVADSGVTETETEVSADAIMTADSADALTLRPSEAVLLLTAEASKTNSKKIHA